MKWRTRLAVLLAFLLPVPLIWSSSRLLIGELNVPVAHEESGGLVPILPPDETRRLPTYERPCEENADCDVPLVCLRNQLGLKRACVASECATDRDCREEFSCHSIAAGERVVRLCGASGELKEGEFCMELSLQQDMTCAPGLVCTQKRCRRPCQLQAPRSCPEGYFCSASDAKGSVCLPSCEGRSCPEGQRCVAMDHGVSVCARVHGMDCQLNPCPAEQVCQVSAGKAQGDVWMRCMLSCGKQGPSCPVGFSCMGEYCYQRCSSDAPGSCGPMEVCAGFSERDTGVCIFDFDK